MRKENLCRKKISQVSMYVALFTLALIGDRQFRQSVKILWWTIYWLKHGEAHVISPCLVFAFKSVFTFLRCTNNALWWVIMNSYDSTISCWLYLLFMARSARFVLLYTSGIKRKQTSVKNPQKWMLYWSIFMIVTCYAQLISMARISENQWHQCLP